MLERVAEVRHLGCAGAVAAGGASLRWSGRCVAAAVGAVGLVQLLRGALADASLGDQRIELTLARHLLLPFCRWSETPLFYHNYVNL